ncbi:hypothetical protein TIFTF001_029504 [Ficus carica]|uniref:Uncharacterized protein n=1 Tax=Ficus carica TaxID=3494 RepID=A0AA88DSI0_FICCA|nr:hypothetical protein TIFTF001_029504 [Ficus carica]
MCSIETTEEASESTSQPPSSNNIFSGSSSAPASTSASYGGISCSGTTGIESSAISAGTNRLISGGNPFRKITKACSSGLGKSCGI